MTTEPPPRARMWGRAARVIWSEPKRLVSMILRQMARSTSSKLWKASKRKALFTSTSTPPNAAAAASIKRRAGLGVGDVGRDGEAARPQLAQLGRHLVEGRLAAGRQHQVGAMARPRPGPPAGPGRVPRPTRCTPCPPAGRSPATWPRSPSVVVMGAA